MNTEKKSDATHDDLVSRLRALGAMDPGTDFAGRVMDRIGTAAPLPEPRSRARRVLDWLVQPRTIRVSPLGGLAAAACLLLSLGVMFGRVPGNLAPQAPEGLSRVTFVLAAPSARDVAVIGSFNGWKAAGWNMRHDPATGLWTLSAALPTGTHEYVFLIDGTTPVADASAALSADDGFGGRNSILLVKGDHGTAL